MDTAWSAVHSSPLRWFASLPDARKGQLRAMWRSNRGVTNEAAQQAHLLSGAIHRAGELLLAAPCGTADVASAFAKAAVDASPAFLPTAAAVQGAYLPTQEAAGALAAFIRPTEAAFALHCTLGAEGVLGQLHMQLLQDTFGAAEVLAGAVLEGRFQAVAESACRTLSLDIIAARVGSLVQCGATAAASCLAQAWGKEQGLPAGLAQVEQPSGEDIVVQQEALNEGIVQWGRFVAPWAETDDATDSMLQRLQHLAVFVQHVQGAHVSKQHQFWEAVGED
jgi:hypothetical protein